MIIINGQNIAKKILESVKKRIEQFNVKPVLKIYIVGANPSSVFYIEKKRKKGLEVGIEVKIEHFPDAVEVHQLGSNIKNASKDNDINGIIVQLPVENKAIHECFKYIDPQKDVDGLNPYSLGALWQNNKDVLIPATVKAIISVLEDISMQEGEKNLNDFLSGKNALIINRSFIIGKPLAAFLINNDSTVTIAHSKSNNIKELVINSDIIISATGIPGFLNQFEFKKTSIIIDAGFNYLEGKSIGDYIVSPINDDRCAYLCPVPNGVGPIGVASLLENTLITSLNSQKLNKFETNC